MAGGGLTLQEVFCLATPVAGCPVQEVAEGLPPSPVFTLLSVLSLHPALPSTLNPKSPVQASPSWRMQMMQVDATLIAAPSSSPRETQPRPWRWLGSVWWAAIASVSSPSGVLGMLCWQKGPRAAGKSKAAWYIREEVQQAPLISLGCAMCSLTQRCCVCPHHLLPSMPSSVLKCPQPVAPARCPLSSGASCSTCATPVLHRSQATLKSKTSSRSWACRCVWQPTIHPSIWQSCRCVLPTCLSVQSGRQVVVASCGGCGCEWGGWQPMLIMCGFPPSLVTCSTERCTLMPSRCGMAT